MKYIVQPWLIEHGDGPGEEENKDGTGGGTAGWKSLALMKTPRANFACCVFDNLVYVFGGISGRGEK